MHGDRQGDFFDLLWRELLLLMPDLSGRRVLDLGCGDGSFYHGLKFEGSEYTGVDLSPAMLEHFARRHIGVELHLGAAQSFEPSAPVDFVFSHGVIQYLSAADLRRHFELAFQYLNAGGKVLHAGIPWSALRGEFELGGLWDRPAPGLKKYVGFVLRAVSASPQLKSIGHWYSPAQYRAAASATGFEVEFYGSLAYPYRFHAMATKGAGRERL